MGTLTIVSAEVVRPAPSFLPLRVTFTDTTTNAKQTINITDGLGPGLGNVQNYRIPAGITVIQPAVWDVQNYTNQPDELTINSIGIFLDENATGILVFTEEDTVTLPSLPVTIPINAGSLSTQYIVGLEAYTSGTGLTRIIMNITLTDSISGDTYTEDVYIDFDI